MSVPVLPLETIPFSRHELERRYDDILEIVERIEQARDDFYDCENRELKEAYRLVYTDWRWKLVCRIKDLWIWTNSKEVLEKPATATTPPALPPVGTRIDFVSELKNDVITHM